MRHKFALLLLLVAWPESVVCGDRVPEVPHVLGRLVASPDGRWLAFTATLGSRAQRPYIVVDLKTATLAKWGMIDRGRPSIETVVGWLEAEQAVVIRWLHPREGSGELDAELQILAVAPGSHDRLVRAYHCPDSDAFIAPRAALGYPSCFALTRHQDAVLFSEDGRRGVALPGTQPALSQLDYANNQQLIHRVNIATGKDVVVGTLPGGWRCIALGERSGDTSGETEFIARYCQELWMRPVKRLPS